MTRTNDDEPPEWAKEQAREMMAAEEPSDDGETQKGDGGEADGNDGKRDADGDDRIPDVPADTVDEAERLTRLARRTEDDAAAAFYRERRDDLVTGHDYVPRLREEDDTLVLYPDEWMDDGTVQLDRIETTDRAVEVSLSGPGDADRYREIAAYNDAVADAVDDAHDTVHADTARSFAAFMSNHYVRAVDDATPDMRAEFREEYFPRNGWPSDEQLAVLDESLDVIESVAAGVDGPEES
jgi:hypothetical protein